MDFSRHPLSTRVIVLTIPLGRVHRTVLVCAALALTGCQDAPTMTDSVQRIAGGEAWVAVPEPAALPTLDTWVPYLPSGEVESAVVVRIHEMRDQARLAREDGRLAWAEELDREAVRLAVLSLERAPDPRVVAEGLAALMEWSDRVAASVDLRAYRDLSASVDLVRRSGDVARRALEEGDTTTAVLRISDAAESIRYHSPRNVALRVLGRAEAGLREREGQGATVRRALHLVRSARHELLAGDPSRALQRGLYALQLLEGRQLTGVRDVIR